MIDEGPVDGNHCKFCNNCERQLSFPKKQIWTIRQFKIVVFISPEMVNPVVRK